MVITGSTPLSTAPPLLELTNAVLKLGGEELNLYLPVDEVRSEDVDRGKLGSSYFFSIMSPIVPLPLLI